MGFRQKQGLEKGCWTAWDLLFLLLVKIILYWRNNSQANDRKLVNLQPLGNCFTRGWKRPLKGCASPSALRWHNGVNNLFCFVLFLWKIMYEREQKTTARFLITKWCEKAGYYVLKLHHEEMKLDMFCFSYLRVIRIFFVSIWFMFLTSN